MFQHGVAELAGEIPRVDAAAAQLRMIKRVRKPLLGGCQLNSDNRSASPIRVQDGELQVIGRVIWIGWRG